MAQGTDETTVAIAARDDDDEGLFSRDINGQLVRLDSPTESDYGKSVTLQIDAQPITVPLAEPLKDAQGNVVLDIDGRTTPRYTTIYDAALKLAGDDGKIAIPVLCHQPHMTPVAVCRMCVVQIYGQKRGKRAPERKLLPACQHQVKNGMEVFTMNGPGEDGERVRRAVGVMTELLTAEHLKPAPLPAPAADLAPFNELQQLSDRCGLTGSRFKLDVLTIVPHPAAPQPAASLDASSSVFLVDHSACILCDRCSRACDEVQENHVIGRTGKGQTTGIGFDLNDPMGKSSCVQCGECMVSCPTSAITFKPVGKVKLPAGARNMEVIPAQELMRDPLFAGVPPKFLFWQEGLVVRRRVKPGDVLCRQGEPGNTAFVIKSGSFNVLAGQTNHAKHTGRRDKAKTPQAKPPEPWKVTAADVVVGEMTCLSGTPRTAEVVALEEGEVWEVRRNVLDRIMRSPTQRDRFEKIYRKRAIGLVLRSAELFKDLPADEYKSCVEFLQSRLTFVRVNPGQTIFEQGDWADAFYLVRLGHVRVGINQFGKESTVVYRSAGTVIGEIGLLAVSAEDAIKPVDDVDRFLGEALRASGTNLSAAIPAGQRSATCTAMDHLELARVGRNDFLEMMLLYPSVRHRLVELSLIRLRGDVDTAVVGIGGALMREYVKQGLYQGQSLLVLDLDKCTRCDECTKACVQQHGTESHGLPITRLLRDGLRFGGDHLIATSCRSCKDAYCMIGCPVDAIHRGKHQQIIIEDHCIGCGLCASNCPYGNIWMLPNLNDQMESANPDNQNEPQKIARPKAATCDQCDADGEREQPLPRCVNACPHDAAHRMTGDELLAKVTGVQR